MTRVKIYNKRVRRITEQIMLHWECDFVQALIMRHIDFEILKN